MAVPISQMWTVATYVLKQKLKGRRRYPLVSDAGASVSLQPGLRRMRKDPVSSAHPEDRPDAGGVLPRGGGVRRADGLHSRRRAAAASADAGDCGRAGGAQEVRLPVHQRAAAERKAAPVQAQQVPLVLGASGWAARAPRFFRVPRGRVRHCDGGRAGRGGGGVPRDDQYDALRRGRPGKRARALRRDDGGGRREHDGVARLYLRQGPRPEPFSGQGALAQAVSRHPVEPQEERGTSIRTRCFRSI